MHSKRKINSTRKTALITGASKGIGRAISKVFAANNYNLVLISRTKSALDKVKEELKPYKVNIVTVEADITKSTDVKNIFKKAYEKFACIDVLVNNAGNGVFKPIEKITSKDWEFVMNLNVKGTFLMTREVIPIFKEAKKGIIINILSDVSKRTFKNGALYTASKFAQLAFADTARKELQEYGVRVTNILPGITATEFAGNDPKQATELKYLQPENIARTIDYILNAPEHIVVDEVMLHPLTQLPT